MMTTLTLAPVRERRAWAQVEALRAAGGLDDLHEADRIERELLGMPTLEEELGDYEMTAHERWARGAC